MLIYNYNPDTGAYLNTSSEADPDPLEPGKWLIPAHSTPLIPPAVPDPKKQQAAFRDGAWVIEVTPKPPAINQNIKDAPTDSLWPRLSIKEVLEGGVT